MNAIFLNGIAGFGNGRGNNLSRSIGPYKVAHWLRQNGYTAQVIDFVNFLPEEVLYKATKHFITSETKIIGLSTTFFAWQAYLHSDGKRYRYPENILNVLKRIKLEFPNIKIVTGGYQADTMPGYGIIDASIMNYKEATEEVFLEYLEHLIHDYPPPESIECSWDEFKRPVFSKASKTLFNIEKDNFKFVKQDCILPGEPLPLDISRGCIFACRFCQYPHLGKKKYDYVRGMEYLEDELVHNYKEFGTTSYYLLDDTFNDTEQKIQEFHKMVKSLPFEISYVGYLRCDLIHRFPDTAYLLQDSGLFGAFFGLESLHPEASKIVGKAWSGKYAREYVPELYHNVWNKKIPVHTNFIVGITHDTKENIFSTVDWFIDNDLHSMMFDRLGLYGEKDQRFFAIKSEFDRNSSKYGYTILNPISGSAFPDWKNDNWTRETATTIANEANKIVEQHRKIITWGVPAMMWYGATKEEILNFKINDYPKIADRVLKTEDLLKKYVQMLLSI